MSSGRDTVEKSAGFLRRHRWSTARPRDRETARPRDRETARPRGRRRRAQGARRSGFDETRRRRGSLATALRPSGSCIPLRSRPMSGRDQRPRARDLPPAARRKSRPMRSTTGGGGSAGHISHRRGSERLPCVSLFLLTAGHPELLQLDQRALAGIELDGKGDEVKNDRPESIDPMGRDTPSSGLNPPRLYPRFTSRPRSYWPCGGTTVTLAANRGADCAPHAAPSELPSSRRCIRKRSSPTSRTLNGSLRSSIPATPRDSISLLVNSCGPR